MLVLMLLILYSALSSANDMCMHDMQRALSIPASVATTQPISGSKISQTNGTAGYTISQSGYYYLSSDINYQPDNTGRSAILINTSNVTLDLAGRTIIQGNAATSTIAVKVAAGVKNILIKNGSITGFTETATGALSIGTGCTDVTLDSLQVINCSGTGIYATGCQRLLVINTFSGNHTSTTAAVVAGLNVVSSNDVVVRNCDFSFVSTNQQIAASGAYFDNCVGIYAYDSKATNNSNTNATASTSNTVSGWSLVNTTASCKNFYFMNCRGNSQSATAGIAYGFYLNSATAGYFENCITDSNQSPATAGAANALDGLNAYGFYLLSSTANSFKNCKARRQSTGVTGATAQYRDAVGFYSRLGEGNKFIGCEAAYNSSGGTFNLSTVPSGGGGRPGTWPTQAVYYGFLFNPDTGSIPTATQGEQTSYSAGFYLHQETGSTIQECSAYSNLAGNPNGTGVGSNNGISVGIYLNRRALSSTGTPPSYTVSPCQQCVIVNNITYDNHSLGSDGINTCRSHGVWEHAQVNTTGCYQYNETYSTAAPMGAIAGSSSIYTGNVSTGHGQSWNRGTNFSTNIADPTLIISTTLTSVGGFNFFVRYTGAATNTGANYLLEAVYSQQINVNSNNTGNGSFGPFGVWNWSFIHG